MTAQQVLHLYVVFFVLELAFEQLLSVLNLHNVQRHRHELPPTFRGMVDPEQHRRAAGYTLDRGRFAIVSSVLSSAVVLTVVVTGFLGTVDRWVGALGAGPVVHGLVYLLLLTAAFRLVSIPLSLYRQFVIEERWGFNRMTPGLFFADLAKGLAVSAVIGAPLLSGLLWLIRSAGTWWWVYAFAATALVQLGMTVLYPLLIAPLFNRFTPLTDEALAERLSRRADSLGFATSGIFVMDGSRRSTHSNAYFTGIGRSKRVVLFDTLVQRLTPEQLEAVLAHEIGHYKKRHVIRRVVLSMTLLLAVFFVINLLAGFGPLYRAFGFHAASAHGIFVILGIAAGPFTFFLTPLFTSWSRRHEYAADRFAVRAMGSPDPLIGALLALSTENLTNLVPHPWYSFYHYSHPTLGERIRGMKEAAV
jgi:STE24 endopeptidase